MTEKKTSHGKIFEVKYSDVDNVINIVKTQQIGDSEPEVIDFVKEITDETSSVEKFTIIKNDPKTGVPISHTNDITIIESDRFYPRIKSFL